MEYNSKYLQKYIDLIFIGWKRHFKDRNLIVDEYYENHHWIPKSWFKQNGGYIDGDANNPINYVKLEAREHFLAHYYLMKAFPSLDTTKHAAFVVGRFLNKGIRNEKQIAEMYHEVKKAHILAIKKRMIGKSNPSVSLSNKKRKGESRPTKGMPGSPRPRLSLFNKRNSKPVLCRELGLIFLSAQEAARFAGLKKSGDINRAAKGGRKTAGNYSWYYPFSDI